MSVRDPNYVRWWIDQAAISPGEGLAEYAQFLSTLDSRPFLKRITVPMLILAPANSVATKLEEQRWIQSQVKGAQMEIIKNGGHEIYVGASQHCQNALIKFLDSLHNTCAI
ncbi:uncharacterized protein PV06_11674 [Exophiala oligosperma]|uniref:AB hydrolase-1 domain-containing protein n=1 Tax=Exophiala oligosperma TaxID=215243 RepID=A0A0D2DK09_9EURO|nr:uncharacterized protein PV06_11674 [Exophiala oligosperma]KIW36019.1 hypothetical protein PV06_11674 [Exophiala oligosperma]